MRSRFAFIAASLLIAALPGAAALAQGPTHRVNVAPVDQAVSDQDPLAGSQRRVDPGNAALTGDARVYDRFAPAHWTPGAPAPVLPGLAGQRRYTLIGQGFEAQFNRPDYLVERRGPNGKPRVKLNAAPGPAGKSALIIPADTVFQLIPPDQRRAPPRYNPYAPRPHERRIDGRIDGRVRDPYTDKPIQPMRSIQPVRPRGAAGRRGRPGALGTPARGRSARRSGHQIARPSALRAMHVVARGGGASPDAIANTAAR